MRALQSKVQSSARLTLLAQNHTGIQVSSAHRSRFSLIEHSWKALTLLTQNHSRIEASSAHRLHCLLIQRSRHTLLTLLMQNHTQTGVICSVTPNSFFYIRPNRIVQKNTEYSDENEYSAKYWIFGQIPNIWWNGWIFAKCQIFGYFDKYFFTQ